MATFRYEAFAAALASDKKTVQRRVQLVRQTVRLRAPAAILAVIASLERPPVDRGAYRRSWRVANVPGGARVYSTSPYAAVIEHGRRRGARMPPLQVIIAWVARKGLVRGVSKNFASHSQYAQLRSIAFLIARRIAKRGLPARHVMRIAMRTVDRAVRQALRSGQPGG